jgi:hypothetical protein
MPTTNPIADYWLDAWQRSVLTLDVLRQRGNIYYEHNAMNAPNVLSFKAGLVLDGRTLERPVNYVLARIVPPDGKEADPTKRPFIVVDPRAGHGPGIGGMKQDSEIGVALEGGHPCYFVGFLPNPMPGQTIEDVCRAEAIFLEEVIRRHPEAEGKPAVIANCQAGWQMMMTAALRPKLPGPIVLAGSPLSYWAGVRGKNPMRYLGGLLGGTWLTALTGDMGKGIFDGANLVSNFESLNPANTYWEKPYGLYSKVDTEAQRFLDFETWWGSPVLLNGGEMQWIADNLFVGNKLTAGEIHASDGTRIDLRNIRSPIVVFCSWGDNITPPQQALGWITDLYTHESDIVANGQTIVYTTHQTIGHLGIFVSGKVATKEHAARPVRGGDHRGHARHRQPRADPRPLPVQARGALARRHPRLRQQRRRGRPPLRHHGAAVGGQSRAVPRLRPAVREGDGHRPVGPGDARLASEPVALRGLLRPQSADEGCRGRGRAGARQPQAGRLRQPAARRRAGGFVVDLDLAGRAQDLARRHDRGVLRQLLRRAAVAGTDRHGQRLGRASRRS